MFFYIVCVSRPVTGWTWQNTKKWEKFTRAKDNSVKAYSVYWKDSWLLQYCSDFRSWLWVLNEQTAYCAPTYGMGGLILRSGRPSVCFSVSPMLLAQQRCILHVGLKSKPLVSQRGPEVTETAKKTVVAGAESETFARWLHHRCAAIALTSAVRGMVSFRSALPSCVLNSPRSK